MKTLNTKLVNLADALDDKGFTKEANQVDLFIKQLQAI